jgi:hypothetical protein
MRTQPLVSSLERIGTHEVSALVRTVVTSLRPQWVSIDAYVRPADAVEDVRRRLASMPGACFGGGVSPRSNPFEIQAGLKDGGY